MRAVIHRTKHPIQWTLQTITPLATLASETIVTAVQSTLANLANEVEEGAIVKAVFVELWVTSDDTSGSSFVATLEKLPGSGGSMSYAESIDLFSYTNKKNILYTTMGLVGPNDEVPIPLIRQWFKIPKGKQRFGLGDKLVLNISAITNGLNYCGHALYKEDT